MIRLLVLWATFRLAEQEGDSFYASSDVRMFPVSTLFTRVKETQASSKEVELIKTIASNSTKIQQIQQLGNWQRKLFKK